MDLMIILIAAPLPLIVVTFSFPMLYWSVIVVLSIIEVTFWSGSLPRLIINHLIILRILYLIVRLIWRIRSFFFFKRAFSRWDLLFLFYITVMIGYVLMIWPNLILVIDLVFWKIFGFSIVVWRVLNGWFNLLKILLFWRVTKL